MGRQSRGIGSPSVTHRAHATKGSSLSYTTPLVSVTTQDPKRRRRRTCERQPPGQPLDEGDGRTDRVRGNQHGLRPQRLLSLHGVLEPVALQFHVIGGNVEKVIVQVDAPHLLLGCGAQDLQSSHRCQITVPAISGW